MKILNGVTTEQYELDVVECVCGYHMGIDFSFVDQVWDFKCQCPSCGEQIDTSLIGASLRCVACIRSNMFTCGAAYEIKEIGPTQITVVDALGHDRVISRDVMRFIVGHTKEDVLGTPLYAKFLIEKAYEE